MRRLTLLALLVAACATPLRAQDEPDPMGIEPVRLDVRGLPGADTVALALGELPSGLVDEGRRLLATGGRAGLLRSRRVALGSPSKEAVRAWSVRFRDTDDLGEAWALAQAMRFADHIHWGTIWMHDGPAQQVLAEVAKDAAHPWKAALAAECLGDRAFMRALLLDTAAHPVLRAFGAANVGAPERETESAARAVLTPMLELLRGDDAQVRAMAAVHVAEWCVTLDDQRHVLDLAGSESSPIVLSALFASIRAFGVPTARSLLTDIAADEARPGPAREAARSAQRSLAIRPDG